MALMDKAKKANQAGEFTKPDVSPFVPPGMEDQVDRIVAAGMKLMYAPEMRDDVMDAVQSDEPTAKKLAENVTGLMLALDQKAEGGMPIEAIFPAAIGLMGEAAEVLQAAGQPVSQEDFNEGARMVFVMIGKQMGASDDDIMGAAQQHAGDDGEDDAMPEDQAIDAAPPSGMQQQPMQGGM